ncbi:MAG: PolC-type DNA polymerase III [Ruminococcaceae bacterium]|nr:PolC-type DNA polymerase III [Oscillospiraceae bacterium]
MENYTLKTAFPNVPCAETLENAEVLNIKADINKRKISAEVICNDIADYSDVEKFEEEVKKFYELVEFDLNIQFHTDSSREIECVNYCVDVLGEKNPLWRAVLDSCIIEADDETVKISLRHGNLDLMEEEAVDREIATLLENKFGLKRKIVFDTNEMTVDTTLEPIAAPKADSGPKKIVSFATEGALIGKPFTPNDFTPIKEIDNYAGQCMVYGDIFGIDCKEIPKIKKTIVSFYITDYTGSLTCKCFVPIAATDEVKGVLKKTGTVAVRGKAEMDSFSHELTVMARDIIPYSMPKETDDAEEKRVELHAHTKSSAMDAVVSAKDLVKQAMKYGHKAIAITDHGCVQAFPEAFHTADETIKILYGCEGYLIEAGAPLVRETKRYHIIIFAQNLVGLKNLYKLISASNLQYFHRRPLIPRDVLDAHREGLILGSACEAGELFRAILFGENEETVEKIASYYDYLEVQPIGNNDYLVRNGTVADREGLCELNRKIIALGEKMGKPVVATGDVHFLRKRDEVFRRILQAGQGYDDADMQAPLYFRTTQEMLDEFSYLPPEKAYEIVVTNTNKIADMIENIRPVPKGNFPPKIDGSAEDIERIARETAENLYGNPLPKEVEERLQRELKSVIGNGYADLYNIARLLVKHSREEGYVVGSRGSVGSSFLAYCAQITEVNSLQPHYRCPNCKNSEFIYDESFDSGHDMPDKKCPVCGTDYVKDGHNIPFETFLGFKGDKQPDIDLNFSGENQASAHKYTEEIFGEGYVFRAGTVSTVAEKTAYGYVRKYFESKGINVHNAEVERLKQGVMNVKTTTGQHPGGVIVLPKGHDIHEFTPIQHPAEKAESGIITTHFDYHSIDENLLKLDILGHDDPTMIRMLQDLTGIDPTQIPLDDKKVMSLFLNTEALGVTPEDIGSETGTFAVPEFGTKFVRQMLVDTKPTSMGELIRISGLSHGTDVWTNNAQLLVQNGTCTLRNAICCRDDIMIYLINRELPPERAFKIMEQVRKGKKLKPEDEAEMREHNVPEWYIESCNKIQYMFPRAHAAAYVTMSLRVAYFKVHYPIAFYQSYYTVRADTFDYETMATGRENLLAKMRDLSQMENPSARDKATLTIMEVVNEMYARGIEFMPIDIYMSHPTKYLNINGKILPALNSVAGLGDRAAQSIADARENGKFFSIDDFKQRTSVSETHIELLKSFGCFKGIPQSAQVDMFEILGNM